MSAQDLAAAAGRRIIAAMRILAVLFALSLACVSLAACKDAGTATPEDGAGASQAEDADAGGPAPVDEFAGREVVNNWEAEVGDVTVCPISGKKFEVEDGAGHFSYQGYDFVFCCAGKCLEQVEANPGKFLDALVEQAGGPATDPDPDLGGAIEE